jgi:hypothetical protein
MLPLSCMNGLTICVHVILYDRRLPALCRCAGMLIICTCMIRARVVCLECNVWSIVVNVISCVDTYSSLYNI